MLLKLGGDQLTLGGERLILGAEDPVPPSPNGRGDDAAFRSSGARERFWANKAEDWLEDRLERIEDVAREPKKTRKTFAANFLEKAESLAVPQVQIDALAELMAMLTAPVPDYTALALDVAEWMARIAADRRTRREKRDIDALRALGEL